MRLCSALNRPCLLLCVLLFAKVCLAQETPLIKPPALNEATTVKLPAAASDVVIGGDGRYILYLFSSLQKIGVFDVNEAELTHFISTPDDGCKIAAGMTKLLIVAGDGGTISRYDIATGERELTKAIELPEAPTVLVMGSASQGPAFVNGGEQLVVDLETLKTSKLKTTGEKSTGNLILKVSANGKTLTRGETERSSGTEMIVLRGSKWFSWKVHGSGGLLSLSADGRFLFTFNGIYHQQLRPINTPKEIKNGGLISAVHGDFYLGVTDSEDPNPSGNMFDALVRSSSGNGSHESISVYMQGDVRPLTSISSDNPDFRIDIAPRSSRRKGLSLDKKCLLIPRANLLVQLSTSNETLLLTPVDIKGALAKSELDFLFVQSNPINEITAGKTFQYQVDTLSKLGGVKYSLASAPQGMRISNSGLVTWPTSKESPAKNSAIVTVADKSGQEIFHTFSLRVSGASGQVALSPESNKFSTETGVSFKSAPLSSTVKDRSIKLPQTTETWIVGGGGRFILLHFQDLQKIGLFDVAKAKITHYFPALGDNALLAAGANHLLILDQDQGVISRYNLTTLERELTKPFPFEGKVVSIAMGSNSYGPVIARWTATGPLEAASLGLIDLETLAESKIEWPERNRHSLSNHEHSFTTVSTNGKTFYISKTGWLYRVRGTQIEKQLLSSSSMSDNGLPKFPSADGQYVASDGTIYDSKMMPITDKHPQSHIVPAITGQHYLRLSLSSDPLNAKLYRFGNSRPIEVNNLPVGFDAPVSKKHLIYCGGNLRAFGWFINKNVMFLPDAKLIVCVGPTFDSLTLRHFDIEKAVSAASDAVEESSNPKNKTVHTIETWTDVTGNHNMEGKFLEIQDESKVILQLEDGSKKSIPLERLTGAHIYRAVKYDLLQRNATSEK